MEKFDEGLVKWGILGAAIVALEYVGEESLTHAFGRAREHSVGRFVAVGALAVTAAHLMDIIPHQYDPYYAIAGNFGTLKLDKQP